MNQTYTWPWKRSAGLVLFLALQLLAAPAARAQQAPATIRLSPEDLERGLNGPQSNFHFLPPGVQGEENYKSAGFFGGKLRPYLAGNREALLNLDYYRRQKSLYLTERLVFVAAVSVYGQQVFAPATGQQYFNTLQKTMIGVGLGSLLTNILISRNTNSHLQRAVEAYNAEVPGRRGSLWQRARPSSLGLGSTSTGWPVLALEWTVR